MKNKMIVVGISGGIAAYKACEIVSSLKKLGADVHVIMTQNAAKFVSPLTFESLSDNPVSLDMFDVKREKGIRHISLAKECDLALIAPCTANVIGKLASGIADDFLSTFALACKAPIVLAPAMNTNMLTSEACTFNSALLKRRGYLFIEPDSGVLACGDSGKGRLADPKVIVVYVQKILAKAKDYAGKKLVVTAGGTVSPIDPVRCIANHSSGKMGIEIARAAKERGADVTLILGKTTENIDFQCNLIEVQTTAQMYSAVMESISGADYIIKAAAPSDYEVVEIIESDGCALAIQSSAKLKGETLTLRLKKGVDIASEVGRVKGGAKLVIFAAETENTAKNALEKLNRKNADMVVANNVTLQGAGFNCDTNIASLIFPSGKQIDLEKMTKRELAHTILSSLKELD